MNPIVTPKKIYYYETFEIGAIQFDWFWDLIDQVKMIPVLGEIEIEHGRDWIWDGEYEWETETDESYEFKSTIKNYLEV